MTVQEFWNSAISFLNLCGLLCHTASKVCSDLFSGICIRVSSAENLVEKQGVSKGCLMEFLYSGLICGKDEIFL